MKTKAVGAVMVEVWNQKKNESEWLPGFVTGYRAGEPSEDFERVNVQLTDGRAFDGCHPDCVKQDLPFEITHEGQLTIF